MAIAKATPAQQQELLRQLNILGKDLYATLRSRRTWSRPALPSIPRLLHLKLQ
ncbi:hypothetical protein P643_06 [Klebsiella phage QL]|uniref:Uncharacterized protein n=1 Tax=Klebsiella phage QL TaxID=3062018 RepID=A0AAX4ASR3_9CAUD|nr:hypothetical protein P643_06 [Klebsiella phage QL]